jgi:hypothetical protein
MYWQIISVTSANLNFEILPAKFTWYTFFGVRVYCGSLILLHRPPGISLPTCRRVVDNTCGVTRYIRNGLSCENDKNLSASVQQNHKPIPEALRLSDHAVFSSRRISNSKAPIVRDFVKGVGDQRRLQQRDRLVRRHIYYRRNLFVTKNPSRSGLSLIQTMNQTWKR